MKKKVVLSVLLLMLVMAFFQTIIYAEGTTGGSSFDYKSKMKDMTSQSGKEDVVNPVKDIAGTAIVVAQVIAVGVAIIMLIVLAMKYMMSAPGEKATIKKHAVVYIVGAVVMFAATGILELIRKFAGIISDEGGATE